MDQSIVAVGSLEQHGPHLPLETDTLIARAVAERVADIIGARFIGVVEVGLSPEHLDFPGTKTLSVAAFKKRILDMGKSASEVVYINGHGGNNKTLREMGVRHVNLTSFFRPYDHAGEIETSLIMHLRPELVRTKEIRKHVFRWPDKDGWRMKDYSETGVLGDPTKASGEKGKIYLEKLVSSAVKEIGKNP